MKKALFMILVVAMLALCLTLAACGGETPAETTKPAMTTAVLYNPAETTATTTAPVTAADTTPTATLPETTVPVTTPTVVTTPDNTPSVTPEQPAKVGVSYTYFLASYMFTTMDENGRTLKRELYKPETMQKSDTYMEFSYAYDENGKLTSYVSSWGGELVDGVIVWEDDGCTALVSDPVTEELVARILFDENGVIDEEYWLEGEEVIFFFDYDENGRLEQEVIPGEMQLTVITTYDGNEGTVSFEYMYTKIADILITYTDDGYPISMQNRLETNVFVYSYEYDEYNRCIESSAVRYGEENFYYMTYDKANRLETMVVENSYEIVESVYSYNEKNLKETVTETHKTLDGEVESIYVTTYEYNEFDRDTKKTQIEYTENGDLRETIVTESEYNERGGLVKRTISRYNANGNLTDREVTEY